MRDEELIEKVRDGVRRLDANPRELWERLIQEGVIDQEGNVLLGVPQPLHKKKLKKRAKFTDGKDGPA